MKIFGIAGWKNTGKTGLTERLLYEYCRRGLRVSTIKHAHHDADIDRPGRDSFKHRQAGAHEVILSTPRRWALMHELRGADEPSLAQLLGRLSPVDLVLIEGYKRAAHPKIETYRSVSGKPLLANENRSIRAIASDCQVATTLPLFDLDDTTAIADFILSEAAK